METEEKLLALRKQNDRNIKILTAIHYIEDEIIDLPIQTKWNIYHFLQEIVKQI